MSRRALTIAKYLIKNDFINPVIKSRGGLLTIVFMACFIVVIAIVGATSVTHPHKHLSGSGRVLPLYLFLARYGLTKEVITDLLSTLLIIATTYALFLGRSKSLIIKEEIYELIMSQPISIDDVLIARVIYDAAFPITSLAPFLLFIVLITAGTVGILKSVLIIPSSVILLLYITVITDLGRAFRVVASNSLIKVCRVVTITYLVIGLTHSLMIKGISLILTTPLRPLAASLTYPLARSSTLLDTSLAIAGSSTLITAYVLLMLLLSNYLSTEDFKPLEQLLKEGVRRGRSLVGTEVKGAGGAVKAYLLGTSILNLSHVRNYLILVSAAAGFSVVIKYLIYEVLRINWLLKAVPYLTTFAIPLVVGIMTSSIVSEILANDLLAYWIYRVYAGRMYEVAKALMIKYATYLLEALLIIAVIDSVLSSNLMYLLLPLASLSTVAFASFTILVAIAYIASKRRAIKEAPIKGHILEELAILIVELIIIASLVITELIFDSIALLSTLLMITYVISSIAVASVLHFLLAKVLSKVMETYDVIT